MTYESTSQIFEAVYDPSKSLCPNALISLPYALEIYYIQKNTYRFNLIFKWQNVQIWLMTSKAESKSQYFQICLRPSVWDI